MLPDPLQIFLRDRNMMTSCITNLVGPYMLYPAASSSSAARHADEEYEVIRFL